MTRKQAIKWYHDIQNGRAPMRNDRNDYRKRFAVGAIADKLFDALEFPGAGKEALQNSRSFAYGIEYGVLIAIAKIFELKPGRIDD